MLKIEGANDHVKHIIGVFETRDDGQQAAQSLFEHQIAPERLYMLAGAPATSEQHEDEVD